jgi:hypothetical protein
MVGGDCLWVVTIEQARSLLEDPALNNIGAPARRFDSLPQPVQCWLVVWHMGSNACPRTEEAGVYKSQVVSSESSSHQLSSVADA